MGLLPQRARCLYEWLRCLCGLAGCGRAAVCGTRRPAVFISSGDCLSGDCLPLAQFAYVQDDGRELLQLYAGRAVALRRGEARLDVAGSRHSPSLQSSASRPPALFHPPAPSAHHTFEAAFGSNCGPFRGRVRKVALRVRQPAYACLTSAWGRVPSTRIDYSRPQGAHIHDLCCVRDDRCPLRCIGAVPATFVWEEA